MSQFKSQEQFFDRLRPKGITNLGAVDGNFGDRAILALLVANVLVVSG
mgnify:CR=1 FL=1